MSVELLVELDGRQWPVAGALRAVPDVLEAPEHALDLRGHVRVRFEQGEWSWSDGAVTAIQEFLAAIVELGHTGHGRMPKSDGYGYLRLDAEDPWVRFGGDDWPDARVPYDGLLQGLSERVGELVELLVALGLEGFSTRHLREDRAAAWRAHREPRPEPDTLPPIPPSPTRHDAEGPVLWVEPCGWSCGGHAQQLGDRGVDLLAPARIAVEAGRSLTLSWTHRYGYVRFDAEGDRLRISGDGLPDVRLSRAGWLRALPPARGGLTEP